MLQFDRVPRRGRSRCGGHPVLSRDQRRSPLLTLQLQNAENQRLHDIQTQIEFLRGDGYRMAVMHRSFESHLEDFRVRSSGVRPRSVSVKPRRYRRVRQFFTAAARQQLTLDLPCLRDPRDGWNPKFIAWDDLGPGYAELKRILDQSPDLYLKVRGSREVRPLGRFIGDRYDVNDDRGLSMGKAGLLNLYAKLFAARVRGVGGNAWLRGIQQLLLIRQDRIVALIAEPTAGLIRALEQTPALDDRYRPWRINANGHRQNIPDRFRIEAMHSIKTRDSIGVLQLTVAFAREGGQRRFVLDADIDERGNLLAHFGDFLRHKITGKQTHPYEVYDLLHLSLDNPVLGYRLV